MTSNEPAHVAPVAAALCLAPFCLAPFCLAAVCPAAAAGGTFRLDDAGPGDDSGRINAALAAARPGDVVELAAGRYTLGSMLDLRDRDGVTLRGAGMDATVLAWAGGDRDAAGFSGSAGLTVADLTLDGRNLAGGGFTAFNDPADRTTRDVRFRRVGVRDVGTRNDGFRGFGVSAFNADNVSVTDSRFERIGVDNQFGAAVRFEGSTGLTVAGNRITDTGRNGVQLTRSSNATITNNTVRGTGRFRAFARANALDVNTDGLAIEVFGSGSPEVIARDRPNVGHVIEANTVDHWISVDRGSRVAVRDNVVDGVGSDLTQAIGLEMAAQGSDVIFSGNVVRRADGAGGNQFVGLSISNRGAKHRVLAAGNTLDGLEEFGVELVGMDGNNQGELRRVVLARNTVTGTRRDEDGVRGEDFLFGDATSDGDAIRMLRNVGAVTLIDNLVTGNGRGVVLGDVPGGVDGVALVGNTVTGNGPAPGLLIDFGRPVGDDWPGAAAFFDANAIDGYAGGEPAADAGDFAPLAIAIDGPAEVAAGEQVTLTLTGVDDAEVLWDVGHGLPLTGGTVTVRFAEDERVRVAAWDRATGAGGYAELTVRVVPEPASVGLLVPVGLLLARRR